MVWQFSGTTTYTFTETLLTFYSYCSEQLSILDGFYSSYLDLICTLNNVEVVNLVNFNVSWTVINLFSHVNVSLLPNIINLSYLYILVLGFITTFPTNLTNILLFESEKELNSVDDLIYFVMLILILFLFIINSYFCFLFTGYYYVFAYYMYLIVCVLCVFSIPMFLLLEHGYYYAIYLRGSSVSLSFLYEVLLDYINIISFLLRIGVQFVRILILLLTLITYNELFVEYNNIFLVSSYSFTNNPLTFVVINVISFILEYAHVLIIFTAQCLTFSAMLLWLFQFLFTMFSVTLQENFFFFKK